MISTGKLSIDFAGRCTYLLVWDTSACHSQKSSTWWLSGTDPKSVSSSCLLQPIQRNDDHSTLYLRGDTDLSFQYSYISFLSIGIILIRPHQSDDPWFLAKDCFATIAYLVWVLSSLNLKLNYLGRLSCERACSGRQTIRARAMDVCRS